MGSCMSSSASDAWREDEDTMVAQESPYPTKYHSHEGDKPRKRSIEMKRITNRPTSLASPPAPPETASESKKILLLGTGGSGKSTILKRMLLSRASFSPEERESYRQLIFANIVSGMSDVLQRDLSASVGNDPHAAPVHAARFMLRDGEPYPAYLGAALRALWREQAVKEAIERDEAFALDNLRYYLLNLDRLFDSSYVPSDTDILHSYARTLGVYTTAFPGPAGFTLVDVGGQRSARKKWEYCCAGEDAAAVVFVVSLAGYDRCVAGEGGQNEMRDAMTAWSAVCDRFTGTDVALILIFNKNDLFEQKIGHSDIVNHFLDFDGLPGDAEAGRIFFLNRFCALAERFNEHKKGDLYAFISECATDVESRLPQSILGTVQDNILKKIVMSRPSYDWVALTTNPARRARGEPELPEMLSGPSVISYIAAAAAAAAADPRLPAANSAQHRPGPSPRRGLLKGGRREG